MNAYEVAAEQVGIIARCGAPPAGCRLTALANRHDFGSYDQQIYSRLPSSEAAYTQISTMADMNG